MFFVYCIKNDANKIYIGHSENLENRLARHNNLLKNKLKSYTNKNKLGDWKIIYKEDFETRKEAIVREKQLKGCQGRNFLKQFIR